MYLAVEPQPSNAKAWVAAATVVQEAGGDANNVIVDIADPLTEDDADVAIVSEVDGFLRVHNVNSIAGVANTIFPQATLRRHGPDHLYAAYHDRVLPRMKKMTRDWGRYFERLTRWNKVSGRTHEVINPLQDLIVSMREQVASQRTYRNIYEMTVYDPGRDASKVSNRQCLSFLSFKLTKDNRLLLTVMYRNHAYISRGLGNFIGLGRLQAFVAQQAEVAVGSLTCISTHAEIDHSKRHRDGEIEGWTKTEAAGLLESCRALVA